MADQKFRVVCRNSLLSRAQAAIFMTRAREVNQNIDFEVVFRDTEGDLNQQRPLQEMEGKDFFTRDIQEFLLRGEADFAVHSLKDVSSDLFFKNNHYAIFSREDARDVAIFSENILTAIAAGATIKIGTSSPRRALMATRFLTQALPWINGRQSVTEAVSIRGNVDTRLRKLASGEYDGIILAVAGLNRLLAYKESSEMVRDLLANKKLMVLPLIECPPAPGQGALVVEASEGNDKANALLDKINDSSLAASVTKERQLAAQYGAGCHQQFGVVHVDTDGSSFTYGSGVSKTGEPFVVYDPLPRLDATGKIIFSFGDHMKSMFTYDHYQQSHFPKAKGYLVASHHAVHNSELLKNLADKKVWAAGTKTWIALAKMGLWIEGCADALGLEFLETTLKGPLFQFTRDDITVITDEESASRWKEEGWQSHAVYNVTIAKREEHNTPIANADIIFWTSFKQFLAYKESLKRDVVHCCPAGKTAKLLREAGISPVVFPGIKGFNEWRKINTATTEG